MLVALLQIKKNECYCWCREKKVTEGKVVVGAGAGVKER
jgi:hypothetical protein